MLSVPEVIRYGNNHLYKMKIFFFLSFALLLSFLTGRYLFKEEPITGATKSTMREASGANIWTCSMHPQIQTQEPGDCPICGMDLIPLERDERSEEGSRTLRMSSASRALAAIQTTVVKKDYPVAQIHLVGELDYDETREKSLTARFPARIDELFVNFTGIRVQQGEHLAKVYSPDLLTAQRELLTAYRADPEGLITQAARKKLRLWDLFPEQIDAIIESGEARDHFVLKAPMGGVVVAKNVNEGSYVKTGEPLFKIVDLSVLWAYLDAYESDLSWLRYGQNVAFTVESFPGETFHGKIAFIEPRVDRKTRTISVRVNVPNEEVRLKPGMFIRGLVESRLNSDGSVFAPGFAGKWISPMHPEVVKDGPGSCDVCGMDLVPAEELGFAEKETGLPPLLIPSSAVLRTGKRAVVYVEMPDREEPTFEGREIILGPRTGDHFIVMSGLDAGERVVTNGAFKIDSALQIQAKPSMMNPEVRDLTLGQKQVDFGATSHEHSVHVASDNLEISEPDAIAIIGLYLDLQAALAADDFDASKKALKAMMSISGHSGALPDLLHMMLAADSLDSIRKPHFEMLSNALIEAARKAPSSMPENIMIMHCPMVYGDSGADWLQDAEPLQNPYFGAMMLRCGEVTDRIQSIISEGDRVHEH